MRGGEKVLERIVEIFPNTEIIINLFIEKDISSILACKIHKTTFIQFPIDESLETNYFVGHENK